MVYIGKRKYRFKSMYLSHMIADTVEELHFVAQSIGVNIKHFQDKPGKPHYDICQAKKQLAIKYMNAKEVDDRYIIQHFKHT